MFTIDDSLAPELYPIAFLIGTWQGTGMLGYSNVEQTPFWQEAEFSHDGGPYLAYRSRILVPADDDETSSGTFTRVWSVESGYWRVTAGSDDTQAAGGSAIGGPAAQPSGATKMPGPIVAGLEVMIAEPTGHLSLLVGEVNGARIDLSSDAIVRTATAAEIAAMKRIYGLVEGDLMWATDMAAFGRPMSSYASARLSRAAELGDGQVAEADGT